MPVRIFLIGLANCGGKIYPECELHHFMAQIRRLNEKETDDYMAHIYINSLLPAIIPYMILDTVRASCLQLLPYDFLTQMDGIWV